MTSMTAVSFRRQPTTQPVDSRRNHKSDTTDRDDEVTQEFVAGIEKHKDEFYRFARRTAWSSAAVDDIFSAAILAGYENRHKYTPGTNFRAWMFQILLNKCYSANRETARNVQARGKFSDTIATKSATSQINDVLTDPEALFDLCDDEVRRAFRKLSTAEKACMLLRGIEDYSYKEIAQTLEIPAGTVMTHLNRGRVKLRNELRTYAESSGLFSKNHISQNQ